MNTSPRVRPEFAAALRAQLIAHVAGDRPWWRRRGILGGAAAVAAAVVLAPGLAIAVNHVLPGATEQTALGDPVGGSASGRSQIVLGRVPDDATDVVLALTCNTEGTFRFADGSSLVCGDGDEGSTATVTLPLDPTVTIDASPGAAWTAEATFVNSISHPWATNARGETYGVTNSQGDPDLISAIATNGKQGYVRSSDLEKANGAQAFSSPEEALEWQSETAGTTVALPVYTFDGETQIGEFVIER